MMLVIWLYITVFKGLKFYLGNSKEPIAEYLSRMFSILIVTDTRYVRDY